MSLSKFKIGSLVVHRADSVNYMAKIIGITEVPFQIKAKIVRNSAHGRGSSIGTTFRLMPEMWIPIVSFKHKLKGLI